MMGSIETLTLLLLQVLCGALICLVVFIVMIRRDQDSSRGAPSFPLLGESEEEEEDEDAHWS